jgi:hypothetical protein
VRVRLIVRRFSVANSSSSSGGGGAVLALTMHHAVGDAWSQDVFFRELSAAYDAFSAGLSPSWSPLPIQYGDYAAWQREQLSGASGEALRSFWKTTLAGAPAVVQLPQDRPRPSRPTNVAGTARSVLPDGLLSKLESVARSLRVNLQAVLLAGLQAVLLRYSGQDDLVIGVPVAGRDRQETHGLIGYFINTLPVRCVAVEGASFADMICDASGATLAALDHSLLPLEEVLAASGVSRIPNANPLFQVLFQYMPGDGGAGESRLGDLEFEGFAALGGLAHAKLDLSLTMSGSVISADFMAEIFDRVSIDRLLNSFVTVLEQVVDNMAAPALSGSLLGPGDALEAARLSMGVERPEYLTAPLVHEAFEAIAAEFPERKCLCYEGEWLSYGEVNARSTTLAGQLSSLGIGPGVVVGLMLERSFELVVSILAVFKAGGCYLPCDPSYPDDRLSVYLEDGAAVLVLVKPEHAARAHDLVPASVSVVDIKTVSAASSPLKPPGPEDPAYVIFTSGSTGRPKGVMVPHRGLRELTSWLVELYTLGKIIWWCSSNIRYLGNRLRVRVVFMCSIFDHAEMDDVVMLTSTINFDAHVNQVSM